MNSAPETSANDVLLHIICPVALEESLVDWLLDAELATGFTTFKGAGHGSDPRHLTAAERVAGRRQTVVFQILTDQTKAERMLTELAGEFETAGLHWWIVPVIASGTLGETC